MATPPSWIASLANEVASQMRAFDLLSPLGCHFYHNRAIDQWELTLFASRTEIVGGPLDGTTRPCPYHLDVRQLSNLFDEILQFQWQSHSTGIDDDLGPHLSIEGTYAGQSVWLRILAEAPDRFEVGRSVNTLDQQVKDAW